MAKEANRITPLSSAFHGLLSIFSYVRNCIKAYHARGERFYSIRHRSTVVLTKHITPQMQLLKAEISRILVALGANDTETLSGDNDVIGADDDAYIPCLIANCCSLQFLSSLVDILDKQSHLNLFAVSQTDAVIAKRHNCNRINDLTLSTSMHSSLDAHSSAMKNFQCQTNQ